LTKGLAGYPKQPRGLMLVDLIESQDRSSFSVGIAVKIVGTRSKPLLDEGPRSWDSEAVSPLGIAPPSWP